MALEQLAIPMQKKKKGNPGKDLVPLYKMNSKQITDLM